VKNLVDLQYLLFTGTWRHSKFGSVLCKIRGEKHYTAFVKVVEGSEIYNFPIHHFVHFYSKFLRNTHSKRGTSTRSRAGRAAAAPAPRADVRPLTFGPWTVSPGRSFPMTRAHRDISNLAPAARPRRARPSGPSASTCQARLPRSVHALRGSPAHTRSTPEAMCPVVAPAYKGHAPAGLSTAVARRRSARACAPEDPLLIFGYVVCEVMTNSCTKNGTKLCCKCLYKKLFSISVESA
jgi:hypothetical protein